MNAKTNEFRIRCVIALLLGLITFSLYLPALQHDFITYDDQQYVTENAQVTKGLTWDGLPWAFGFHAGNWHPLTWLSHMLDCQLYGLTPSGHHLTNVILHASNTVLLFVALLQLTGATWRGAGVAALFGWHPLHVESVAWIAERKDLLCTFFWMLSLMTYTQFAKRSQQAMPDRWKWYLLLLLSFALALMSKPMAVTMPCVLLLLDIWPLQRLSLGQFRTDFFKLVYEKAPLFLMVIAVCYLTVSAQQQAIATTAGLAVAHRFLHALVAYTHYVGATFFPTNLAVFYPYNRMLPWHQILLAAVVVGGITVFGICQFKRRPHLPIGWFWFLGTLVPVIGIVQVGDQAWADRYTYIPLIGLFVVIVWTIAEALRGRFLKIGLCAGISLVLLSLTSIQLRHWQNTKTLFTHATKVTHNNHMAITMLGSIMAREGNLTGAISNYQSALKIQPGFPEAHFLLGNALDQQGKLDEAITEYLQAVWFQPIRETTHTLLGIAYGKKLLFDQAAAHLNEAIKINPRSAVAYNSLARIRHTQGQLDDAARHYRHALKLDPLLSQAHNNLGIILLQKGELDAGLAALKESTRLNPTNSESKLNLALALNQNGEWQDAVTIFKEVVTPKLVDANAHYQFGLALDQLGKAREAVSQYARALLIQNDLPAALNNLAWILCTAEDDTLRNGPQALGMAQRACDLTAQAKSGYLVTLAAAYAENLDFETAENILDRIEEHFKDRALMKASFKNQKPWRASEFK